MEPRLKSGVLKSYYEVQYRAGHTAGLDEQAKKLRASIKDASSHLKSISATMLANQATDRRTRAQELYDLKKRIEVLM